MYKDYIIAPYKRDKNRPKREFVQFVITERGKHFDTYVVGCEKRK